MKEQQVRILANVLGLQRLLWEHGKGVGDEEMQIRKDLLVEIIGSGGLDVNVCTAIKQTFIQISTHSLERNSGLVADSIMAWGMAYPGIGDTVIRGLFVDSDSYIVHATEGVTIGLLELFCNCCDDDQLFLYLFNSSLRDNMHKHTATTEGANRLSKALVNFLSPVWNIGTNNKKRLEKVALLLRRYWSLCDSGESSLLFRDNRKEREPANFFRHFADELASKFFLAANTEVKLLILYQFIKTGEFVDVDALRGKYPDLVSKV